MVFTGSTLNLTSLGHLRPPELDFPIGRQTDSTGSISATPSPEISLSFSSSLPLFIHSSPNSFPLENVISLRNTPFYAQQQAPATVYTLFFSTLCFHTPASFLRFFPLFLEPIRYQGYNPVPLPLGLVPMRSLYQYLHFSFFFFLFFRCQLFFSCRNLPVVARFPPSRNAPIVIPHPSSRRNLNREW